MKKNVRTVAMMVVLALVLGLLAGCNNPNNRETSYSGETKKTVNPDVSEPNQSIASGALITETTTETTEAPKTSNTYNLRGKDFTLSVHLEDYIYKLDGSDYEYFNLDEFMKHYGLLDKSGEKYLCNKNNYGNKDIAVFFDIFGSDRRSPSGSGHVVIDMIEISYRQNNDDLPTGSVGGLTGLRLDGMDVYEVNGEYDNGKCYSTYCLSFEQIVLLGVILDCYQKDGNTVAACKSICEVFENGGGNAGANIRLR